MAGYILIDLEITDPEGFQEYLKLAGPTVKQYGGKVLIGGAASETLEGDWHTHLLSVGEFESVEQALRWYNSAEYAPAKALRFKREMQKSYGLRVLDGDLLTSSRRLSPGDSFPHEKGFLLRRLRVSLGALLLQARAFASTGLTFREPRGSFSVLFPPLSLCQGYPEAGCDDLPGRSRSDKYIGCLSQKCPLDPLPLWRSFW